MPPIPSDTEKVFATRALELARSAQSKAENEIFRLQGEVANLEKGRQELWEARAKLQAEIAQYAQDAKDRDNELRQMRARLRDTQREFDQMAGHNQALLAHNAELGRLVEKLAAKEDLAPILEQVMAGFKALVAPPMVTGDLAKYAAPHDGMLGADWQPEEEFVPDIEMDPAMPLPTRGGWVGAPQSPVKDLGNYKENGSS